LLLLIQTLLAFWAGGILILRILILGVSLHSKSPEFHDPRYPDFWTPSAAATIAATTDKLSDSNLTPLQTHPGINMSQVAIAAISAAKLRLHLELALPGLHHASYGCGHITQACARSTAASSMFVTPQTAQCGGSK